MEWEPWVATFMSPYISNVWDNSRQSTGVRYDSAANGLSSVTLVQGIVLPPDAFQPNAAQPAGREACAAGFEPAMTPG